MWTTTKAVFEMLTGLLELQNGSGTRTEIVEHIRKHLRAAYDAGWDDAWRAEQLDKGTVAPHSEATLQDVIDGEQNLWRLQQLKSWTDGATDLDNRT